MDIRWLLCDLVTGIKLTELPLDLGGNALRKVVATAEDATFTLPVLDDRCPEDWDSLLIPGKTMVVPVVEEIPLGGWVVISPPVGDVTVAVACRTLEVCAERTNVPDLDADGIDLATVGALLAAKLTTNFEFAVESEPCGKLSQDYYDATEARTLLDAFNALMAVDGGPEWRIRVDWADDTHRAVTKTIEFRPRIGFVRTHSIFELRPDGGGTIASYTRTPSYAAGKGATSLVGTSTPAGGGAQIATDPIVSALAITEGGTWPVWEDRVDFPDLAADDTVIDIDSELDERTRHTLSLREQGEVVWQLVGKEPASGGLRAGVDYDCGDTVPVRIAPQGKIDPTGGTTTMRLLGYDLDIVSGAGTPILWADPNDDGGS